VTPSVRPLAEEASATPTVLVVEDEVLVRLMAVELLQDAGFRVIEACDADEAMTILDSNVQCDVIFSHVNMPGSIDGIGLVGYAKHAYPTVPVILTSGGVPAHVLSEAAPAAVVPKPYAELDLTRAIARALSTPHG